MNDYKITQQVKRKSKRFAKPLSVTMVHIYGCDGCGTGNSCNYI